MSQEDKCTETLEGDKIGCIYSVMIKMATTTNVQETTEDRRRQKYRKNNPKLVQLSNFKFSAKVSRKRQVDTDFDREYKAKEAARKRRYRAQRIAALLPFFLMKIRTSRFSSNKQGNEGAQSQRSWADW